MGDAFREQRRPVKLEQLLLHHTAHQVCYVHHVNAVAETSLEAVTVQQRHEQLKILLLAVVRSRSHQQKMARYAG